MKTLAILLISIFSTITSFASVVEPLATTVEGKTVTVYFNNDKSETVTISITDKYNFQLLWEEVQTENRRSRGYNFKQLPIGTYTMTIDSDQRIITKEVKVEKNLSSVISEKITYKPTTTFKNNKWLVNHFAQGEEVGVKILDEDYETVFEDSFKNEAVIGKSYSLTELPTGIYRLVIKTDNQSYTKVIAKI